MKKRIFSVQEEYTCHSRCQEYGVGSHQVMEDCNRFFECVLQDDGTWLQNNWQCPESLLYSSQEKRCVDSELKECEAFQNLKCFDMCPRILFTSTDPGVDKEALGCFRLAIKYF